MNGILDRGSIPLTSMRETVAERELIQDMLSEKESIENEHFATVFIQFSSISLLRAEELRAEIR